MGCLFFVFTETGLNVIISYQITGDDVMKINLIGNPEIVMENRNSLHNYFGWPTLARLKNGAIAAAASGNRVAHVCPFGKAVMALSYDEGKTFSKQSIVIDTVLDDRDAGLCPFGESGLIFTSFTLSKSHINDYLTDPGLITCGCEKYIDYAAAYLEHIPEDMNQQFKGSTFCISFDNGQTFSEIYNGPVTSPHGPCELSDGTILWVGPRHTGDRGKSLNKDILAFKINLDGTSEQLGTIPRFENDEGYLYCEPHAIELPNGRIICHIRVQGGINKATGEKKNHFTIYQSESEDGGRTWSIPQQILSDNGGSPAHLMVHSSGMLISTYGYREAPYGVRAMFSEDGGRTWDTDNVIYINNVNGDLGYPSTVELSDGSLLTLFYAHKDADSPAEIYKVKWSFEK